jgi:hypothetical protein
MLRFIAPHRR